jgi:hypothetical protein
LHTLAHVLAGEPVSTPDQVRGSLSPGHALRGHVRVASLYRADRNADVIWFTSARAFVRAACSARAKPGMAMLCGRDGTKGARE